MPYTPICIAKAVKNSAESEGMRRAHVSKAACVEEGMDGDQKARLPLLLCGLELGTGWNLSEPSGVNERMK